MTALRILRPDPEDREPDLAWGDHEPWQATGLHAAERVLCSHGVSVGQVVGKSRTRRVAAARRAVVNVLIQAGWGTCEVARILGGRDHATICYYKARP